MTAGTADAERWLRVTPLGSRPLAKGTYKATLTASVAGLTSAPLSVTFTIVP